MRDVDGNELTGDHALGELFHELALGEAAYDQGFADYKAGRCFDTARYTNDPRRHRELQEREYDSGWEAAKLACVGPRHG